MYRLLWVALAFAADTPKFDTGHCEGPGTGADSWFSGELTITDGVVSGVERWHLFPNASWQARGAKECTLNWVITGNTTASKGKCTSCGLSVTFRAEPHEATSGCPEELMIGRRTELGQRVGGEWNAFDGHYDIDTKADGTVSVFFASSGKALGDGKVQGDKRTWMSRHQCKWF